MKKYFFNPFVYSLVLYLSIVGTVLPTSASAGSYANMSCHNLWYAKNKIFANNGYCFETRKAIDTFGRRCYSPYGRLSGWEKDEVNEIKYWERKNGCHSRRSSTPRYTRERGEYARVSGIRWDDTLAVRSGPSTDYRRVGDLPPDATNVEILECTRSRKWCKIRYRGIVGWSFTKYLRSY